MGWLDSSSCASLRRLGTCHSLARTNTRPTGCRRRNGRTGNRRVLASFAKVVAHNSERMADFVKCLPEGVPPATVIEGDVHSPAILSERSYDMIITSPPYGTAERRWPTASTQASGSDGSGTIPPQ